MVRGGGRVIQVRAKGAADDALLALTLEAVAAARAEGALLLVNDRPEACRVSVDSKVKFPSELPVAPPT